jgi:hypothetical protein
VRRKLVRRDLSLWAKDAGAWSGHREYAVSAGSRTSAGSSQQEIYS